MSMNYKQARVAAGFKQTDVVEILQKKGINIDVSILSRFENGYEKNFAILENELFELYTAENTHEETTNAENEGNEGLQVILQCVPVGSKNGITKDELCQMLNMDERDIRRLIHKTRRYMPILNMQNGKGYFIPDAEDKPIVEKWLDQESKRARSTFWSLMGAKKYLKTI
jgi:hypothetical protein